MDCYTTKGNVFFILWATDHIALSDVCVVDWFLNMYVPWIPVAKMIN